MNVKPVLFILLDSFLIILILFLLFRKKKQKRSVNKYEDVRIENNDLKKTDSSKTERIEERYIEKMGIVLPEDLSFEERKGFEGEQVLYDQIKQVQNVGAKVIWGCWLRYPNGSLTQADVILIWKSGVYVIESKNWTGCNIYGSSSDRNWTVCWFDWKGDVVKTIKKYNPILQNASHIDCIRKMIYNLAPIYSIIAFPDSCKLSKVPDPTKDTAVINFSKLRRAIADFHTSGNKDSLLLNDVDRIWERLTTCSDGVTEKEKELHNKAIREKYKTF